VCVCVCVCVFYILMSHDLQWHVNEAGGRFILPGMMSFSVSEPVKVRCVFKYGVCVCVCVRTLRADGVCESVLYGLPLVLRPTTCWQLDWDEMETNHNLFHALCHTLRVCVCVCV